MLRARLKDEKDNIAGALLAIAAGHHHAAQGDRERARSKFERARRYLEGSRMEPYVAALDDHIANAMDALQALNQQVPLFRPYGR